MDEEASTGSLGELRQHYADRGGASLRTDDHLELERKHIDISILSYIMTGKQVAKRSREAGWLLDRIHGSHFIFDV